jgi:hypothetical protein
LETGLEEQIMPRTYMREPAGADTLELEVVSEGPEAETGRAPCGCGRHSLCRVAEARWRGLSLGELAGDAELFQAARQLFDAHRAEAVAALPVEAAGGVA